MMSVDITGYVEQLRSDLRAAAAAGDESIGRAADRLALALDASVRMVLLEALSDAAAEITGALDATVVDVRMKGREPQFVVTTTGDTSSPSFPPPDPSSASDDDDVATARITLRLPDALKSRAEDAAARSRQSLNTWLIDAIRTATTTPSLRPRPGIGHHISGWAR